MVDGEGNAFSGFQRYNRANGFVDEYWTGEEADNHCYKGMINITGSQLISYGVLGPALLLFLIYLFVGISIVAEIFMEAIEVNTSDV